MKQEKDYKLYNDKEYKRIMELKNEGKFNKMMEACQFYLEKYPYDNMIANMYASYLININKLEEAEEILNLFALNKETKESTIANHYDLRMKILGCKNQYSECYEMLLKHSEVLRKWIKDYFYRTVYLQSKLGLKIDVPMDEKSYTYLMKQAVSYDEQLALEHISKHTDIEDLAHNNSIFVDSFNINEWFYKIKDMIENNDYQIFNSGIFKRIYCFKYDSCGIFYGKNKRIDGFVVYTFKDTNQIISMYPCTDMFQYPSIDINSEIDYQKEKIKRISQIDKFNQKYKKYLK